MVQYPKRTDIDGHLKELERWMRLYIRGDVIDANMINNSLHTVFVDFTLDEQNNGKAVNTDFEYFKKMIR
jgi:hypothetical protein